MIEKGRKIVLISHCILNQNTVVEGLERAEGAFPLAEEIIQSGTGIIQLPCPEFFYEGLKRKGMEYEEYDTGDYREKCRILLQSVIWQINMFIKSGYRFSGIIGINESPSCSLTGRQGVFMEELMKMLESSHIPINLFEIPVNYSEENDNETVRRN